MYLNGLTTILSSFQEDDPARLRYFRIRLNGNGANSVGCKTVMANWLDSLWAIVITTLFDLRFGVGMLDAMKSTFGLFDSFGINDVISGCDFSQERTDSELSCRGSLFF